MARRTTCLYCAEDGVTTPLVQVANWGCCPIHSADFIKRASVPEGWALIRKVTPEELAQGKPRLYSSN